MRHGGSYEVVETGTGEVLVTVIDMNEGRYWDDCPMCGEYRRLDHAVAWYCGPTHDEIGSVSTEYRSGTDEPAIVSGMCVCKECHDRHYER
jgi:hypothetical protein